MTRTLADKLYMGLRKHRDLEKFMKDVASNSQEMRIGFDADTHGIGWVNYYLDDDTTMSFINKRRNGNPFVHIKMASGIQAGNRNVFVENRDLNLINIPDLA